MNTADRIRGDYKPRLLVVDDEATQREMLESILLRAGYAVSIATDGPGALDILGRESIDLLLSDQKMAGMDGLELLSESKKIRPDLPVVLMTAFGSVSAAVDAIKRGASDYLTKPFERDELLHVLEKTLHQRRIEAELCALRGALRGPGRLGDLIGRSDSMLELFSTIERVAATNASVLILGESGTGKELVARAIHALSPRRHGAFVAINCAAVPRELMESEFFGYEKGAFTGADRVHPGRFEQADGGTIFLDEVGAMSLEVQAKLLRVVQEREVQRLGGRIARNVDVRILSATCEDLPKNIDEKTFREDLYYRLNVVSIVVPPLRDRPEDIPPLVERFLESSAPPGSKPRRISSALLARLESYSWPGNVRELRNCIERLSVLAQGDELCPDDLPPAVAAPCGSSSSGIPLPAGGVQLVTLERDFILQALRRTRGSLAPAARLLGLTYKTLQYRIRKHGIDRDEFC